MPTGPSHRRGTLDSWLEHAERLHPLSIDLGLERVAKVAGRLQLRLDMPVITVTGTNGKGSTCAMLEAILRAAGWHTGLYTSPHLLRFNERCRIDGCPVSNEALLPHFAAVESARGTVPLTYFEFTTLAILRLLSQSALDAAVLEVGLGGRLDAVNIVDADCAIVTSVDIDHVDYLGPDRDAIGREKAGICRGGRPFVVADPDPPMELLRELERCGARSIRAGHDYTISRDEGDRWCWGGLGIRVPGMPRPALGGDFQIRNAAAAVAALVALRGHLAVPPVAMAQGLAAVRLPGRLQVISESPRVVLDVAHNPHASRALADAVAGMAHVGKVHAVFGAMRDKDLEGIVAALRQVVNAWYLCALDTPRAASTDRLALALKHTQGTAPAGCFAGPMAALGAARRAASGGDLIVVFGSFHAVAPVLAALDQDHSIERYGPPCSAESDRFLTHSVAA
jgi:dihydrofolate synthase/folylpolyglutamate synthase